MDFEIKAYRSVDGVTAFRVSADSADHAAKLTEARGFRVISVSGDKRNSKQQLQWPFHAKSRFSLGLFTQELLGLLDAGLSLIESLSLLSRKAKEAKSREILFEVHAALTRGESLSGAFEAQPLHFPILYVATIRTSERTGNLVEALRRYLEYHQQMNQVRNKVISASIYPTVLLVVGLVVVLFLMVYVVPRFSHIYEDMGGDLPWLSRVLMAWGNAFNAHAGLLVIGTLSGIALTAYGLSRPATRAYLERKLWSLPAVGEQLRIYQLARFSRTLSMLLSGGIPVMPALEMVEGLLHQPALKSGLIAATREVSEGRAVSNAFERHGLATEVGVRLLAVGERSGDLAHAMDRVAKIYDDEVAQWFDRFTKMFEPVLMIFMGLLIGGIVLLMYMPIFELANSIQ